MLYALRTNVHVWRSPFQLGLDEAVEAAGVTLLDVDWSRFRLLPHDRDHFTWAGYKAFAQAVAGAFAGLVAEGERVLVLADSTVGYWNRDDSPGGAADRYMQRLMPHATVDARCGSGYCARQAEGLDFRRRWRASAPADHTLFVGGWNDEEYGADALAGVARTFRPLRSGRLGRGDP